MQIAIFRDDAYPSLYQWDMLKRKLPDIIKKPMNSINSIENWTIVIGPIIDESIKFLTKSDGTKLYIKDISYTLLMALPFYKNEYKNIESELLEKCSDLIKNGLNETGISINSIIIHLPEYISMDNYAVWCENFFRATPNASISYISLIQPVYFSDSDKDENYLSIQYRIIPRPNKPEFAHELHGEFPVGKTNIGSVKFILNAGFEISKYFYVRQSGHVFADYGDITNGGKMYMRFKNGIITDAVGEFRGEEILFSANFPPATKLVML